MPSARAHLESLLRNRKLDVTLTTATPLAELSPSCLLYTSDAADDLGQLTTTQPTAERSIDLRYARCRQIDIERWREFGERSCRRQRDVELPVSQQRFEVGAGRRHARSLEAIFAFYSP